jgi:hypothetical protein
MVKAAHALQWLCCLSPIRPTTPPPPPLLLLLLRQVCYPKPTDKPLYNGLVTQCRALGIPFLSIEQLQAAGSAPTQQQHQQQGTADAAAGSSSSGGLSAVADVVVDALFGFSFKGSPRPPFDSLLQVSAVQVLRVCCLLGSM